MFITKQLGQNIIKRTQFKNTCKFIKNLKKCGISKTCRNKFFSQNSVQMKFSNFNTEVRTLDDIFSEREDRNIYENDALLEDYLSFQHIKKEYIFEVQKCLNRLVLLESDVLEECVNEFYNNFYPVEKNNKIAQIFYNILLKNQQKIRGNDGQYILQEIDIEEGEQNDQLLEQANQVFLDFKILFEILDKAYMGFLLGDITSKLIFGAKNIVNKTSEVLQVSDDIHHDDIIRQMYEQIRKYSGLEMFKLPAKGVQYPQYETKRNLYERQLMLEEESHDLAMDKFSKIFEDLQNMNMTQNLESYKQYIKDWFPNLCKIIQQEQLACKLGQNKGDRKYYGNFINQVSSHKLAMICLSEFIQGILKLTQAWKKEESSGDKFRSSIISKQLYEKIGKAINLEVIYQDQIKYLRTKEKDDTQKLLDQINEKYEKTEEENKDKEKTFLENLTDDKKSEINRLKMYSTKRLQRELDMLKANINKVKFDTKKFEGQGIPIEIQYKLGAFLVHLMKETIKIKNKDGFFIPLIVPSYKRVQSTFNNTVGFIGILNINEDFLKELFEKGDKQNSPFLHLERSLPMIFKPAKWKDSEIGGYFKRPTNLMRLPETRTQENMQALRYTKLKQLYSILDIVGETSWRINRKVLKVIEQVWEEGGGQGAIPIRDSKKKSNYVYEYQLRECKNYQERKKMERQLQDQKDEHSLRCDYHLKINQAKAFINVAKIYFPHNIDFRGRIYPIPPHLNHMGEDKCRGLLEFSEGRPLGERGIYWLKIHVANKMGRDKLSFEERYSYVEEEIETIKEIARDPMKNRLWLEQEECWQALAAIFDLVAALESPEPEKYVSHIHIHQDGSCNGLQHYAALGRDVEGAIQVNLMNQERPGDIYSHVARLVEAKVQQDSQDKESKYYELAQKLVGNIKRKTIKQTVMTSVYGVTFIGARQQIMKQLKDKDFLKQDDNATYAASFYLAHITLEVIKDLFHSAHYIKQWLIKCASLISATQNPVSWLTPLGLPVIQPYRKQSQFDIIKTATQSITITKSPDNLPVNTSKQQSAFPPNYIHSLDSSHLMYTARECKKEGITFASVHDSYWTHAADVDRMNELLREQFVKLHSEPLLENLLRSFQRRYPTIEFPSIPKRGNLDLDHVKSSAYFFA